ncbi:HAD family hydrolase [Bacteroidota bacterium]
MKFERSLLVLDLDGTITKSDNLVRFTVFMLFNKKRLRFSIFFPLLLLLKFGIIDNNKFKNLYSSLILKNLDISYIDKCAADYCALDSFKKDINKDVLDFMKKYDNAEKVILSANFSFLVIPISNLLDIKSQVSVQLETKENKFSGRTAGIIPFGSAKIDALKEYLEDSKYDATMGLADSKKDIPLLKFLDEGYIVTSNNNSGKTIFIKV